MQQGDSWGVLVHIIGRATGHAVGHATRQARRHAIKRVKAVQQGMS